MVRATVRADEVLADSGGRDGAGFVGGVSSGADDGRVSDTVPALGGDASGGGSGSDVALAVEGDDAYGAVVVRVGRVHQINPRSPQLLRRKPQC